MVRALLETIVQRTGATILARVGREGGERTDGRDNEISIDEVIAATRHCKYGKAAGPDGIATYVIMDFYYSCVATVLHI